MKATCPFCGKSGSLSKKEDADMRLVYSPDESLYYVECRFCWEIGKSAVMGDEAINWFLMGKKDDYKLTGTHYKTIYLGG